MIADRAMPFESAESFDVTCPACGHTWVCSAKGRRIPCGICGKTFKNPNNPYNNRPKKEILNPITCHKCGDTWYPTSTKYRLTCTNCGAWCINNNAKYKPTR
jgi:protein-arginine kinase activator protein McsA